MSQPSPFTCRGPRGPEGPAGTQGEIGLQGPDGPEGPQGVDIPTDISVASMTYAVDPAYTATGVIRIPMPSAPEGGKNLATLINANTTALRTTYGNNLTIEDYEIVVPVGQGGVYRLGYSGNINFGGLNTFADPQSAAFIDFAIQIDSANYCTSSLRLTPFSGNPSFTTEEVITFDPQSSYRLTPYITNSAGLYQGSDNVTGQDYILLNLNMWLEKMSD